MVRDRDTELTRPDTEVEENESTSEMVGEGVGATGGAVLGGAAGAALGPVGAIIGGIAGAVGGWWAGEKAGRAVENWSEEDDTHYRAHHETVEGGVPRYEDARVGYMLGSAAARHPGYGDLGYEDIEADLRHGFMTRDDDWEYSYEEMRPYIREGYTRSRTL